MSQRQRRAKLSRRRWHARASRNVSAAAVATSAALAVTGLEAGAVSAAGPNTGVVAAAVPDTAKPVAAQVASVAAVPGASPTISTPLALKGRLFYGTAASGGGKLWATEGKHAELIKQFTGHSDAAPAELTNVGGDLYFAADGELWKSNGTPKGTVLVDPHVDPTGLADADGTVFIETATGLWKSHGTERETTEIKSLKLRKSADIVAVSGRVYFTVPRSGQFEYGTTPDLWTSDGTAASTQVVRQVHARSGYSQYPLLYDPVELTNVGGHLFFSATINLQEASYTDLWKADGAKAAVVEPYGSDLTNVGGSLYFFDFDKPSNCNTQEAAEGGGCNASTGYALWKNTTPLADFAPKVKAPDGQSTQYAPHVGGLTAVGATLFFAANDGSGATELWRSNGTPAGTRVVDAVAPTQLTNVDGTLCFTADDGTAGPQVWESNGTAAGTIPVTHFADGGTGATTSPGGTTTSGTTGTSTTNTSTTGTSTTGTGTTGTTATPAKPGTAGATPGDLTNLDGTLYFTANDGSAGGSGLWELTP
jgi:ELWxxDGT repeat protein